MRNQHNNPVTDLLKLSAYSTRLSEQLNENANLESWVQDKITKATNDLASVYHYLEYETKFNEYSKHLAKSKTLSEGQKSVIKARLNEAKDKMKELKKAQAEKVKEKKVEEGILTGGEETCSECGGTGMVYREAQPIPDHVKSKVDAYKRLTKATHAAHKRMDANHNGIPDDEEMDEEFTEKSKVGDTFKTRTGVATKTNTGVKHTNTSYHDDGEAEEKSGKGVKSHAKAQSAAEKKDRAPAQKQSPKSAKTWGMKDGSKFDNRDKVDEAKSKKAGKDYDGDGKVESDKDEVWGSRAKAAAKAGHPFKEAKEKCCCEEKGKMKCPVHKPMNEAERTMSRAAKGMMKYGKDGMKALAKAGKDGKDLDKVRDKYDKYDESAPSAGLSKEKKSAVVKKAKAGGDIGKPGKGFAKLAKKAGGGEKGEKIAAAAMWKNIKETTAYIQEKKAAVKNLPGNQEKIDADHDGKIEKSDLAALRAGKKETVKESAEFDRLKALTQRLLG
jgi:hypothetical protein